jgi:predicted metal-binding membrane protein
VGRDDGRDDAAIGGANGHGLRSTPASKPRSRAGWIERDVRGRYLVVWTLFGLTAYGIFEAFRDFSFGWLRWDHGGRWVAGAVLLAGAAYQLSPAKHAC